MTLNLWNLSGGWRERRAEVLAWLELLQPDVVCLQEVIEDADGRNSARWLYDNAGGFEGFAHHGTPTPLFENITFGNAILSRWSIATTNVVDLPDDDPPAEPTGRFVLHVRTNGLDVFCTHLTSLPAHGYLREQQVLATDDAVRRLADPGAAMPPILAGDFNADPDATEIRYLSGLATLDGRSTYYQEAWRVAGGREPGWTWENRNPFMSVQHDTDRRIDYVFVGWRRDDGRGRVETCRVVCDRSLTGVYASDHFGLLAEIRDTPA